MARQQTELLQSLERMKSSLNDIATANEQVKNTVEAYQALHDVLVEYTDTLNTMSSNLENLVDEVGKHETDVVNGYTASIDDVRQKGEKIVNDNKEAMDGAVTSFTTKCNETSDSFKSQLTYELENLQTQVSKLGELETGFNTATQTVKQLNDKIEHLANDIDSTQKQQDQMLDSIKQNVDECNSNVNTQSRAVSNQLSTVADKERAIKQETANIKHAISTLQALSQDINSQCNLMGEALQAISTSISSLSTRADISTLSNNLVSYNANFNSKIHNLEEKIDGIISDLTNSLKANHKATIISTIIILIVVVALHFLF